MRSRLLTRNSSSSSSSRPAFENFVGFWIHTSIDDFIGYSAAEFFYDNGVPSVKFYNGPIDQLREIQLSDVGYALDVGYDFLHAIPPTDYEIATDTCSVEVLSDDSLIVNNNEAAPFGVRDERASTFKIQSHDNDVGYMQLWTLWDGTADNKDYGELENLGRFKRLKHKPKIQLRDDISSKWDNPINMVKYIYDYFTHAAQPERHGSPLPKQYIGDKRFEKLLHELIHGKVERHNKISDEYVDPVGYIGVWKTIAGSISTTLHLKERNFFFPTDDVTISGFRGAFSIINGTHAVSTLTWGSSGPTYSKDHVHSHTQKHCVRILFDSSSIIEDYDPEIHGVAKISVVHRVRSNSTYAETASAIFELASAFGISTHTNIWFFSNADSEYRLDTFSDVAQALTDDNFVRRRYGARTYANSHASALLYLGQGGLALSRNPIADPNDPTGFREFLDSEDPLLDIDVVADNYLESAYNVWFAITGPVLVDAAATSNMADFGYNSNGSRVEFIAYPRGATPPDLVDSYGTHPYTVYQDDPTIMVGGIVRSEYSDGETIAYVRLSSCGGFDPNYFVNFSSLTFGRADMPGNKHISNELAAWASLFTVLNQSNPTKYIVDMRENTGGVLTFANALGSFFGDNRAVLDNASLTDQRNESRDIDLSPGAGIETVNKSYKHNIKATTLVDTDLAASHFPAAMVRGTKRNPIRVNVLDNINAASAGDCLARVFVGEKSRRDLGHHVHVKFIGDIDGRCYSGVTFNTVPTSNPAQLTYEDLPVAPFGFRAEAGTSNNAFDAQDGDYNNQTKSIKPAVLVPMWFDTVWQDLGFIPNKFPYPITANPTLPDVADNTTWRDLALEYAITK